MCINRAPVDEIQPVEDLHLQVLVQSEEAAHAVPVVHTARPQRSFQHVDDDVAPFTLRWR